jgi:hypothetical protein
MKIQEILRKFRACDDAAEWAEGKSWKEIYSTCPRGEWLLWLFVRTNPTAVRERVLVAGLCANTVRDLMTDTRSTAAVDAAIAFGRGEISLEELQRTAESAESAARAAEWVASAAESAEFAAAKIARSKSLGKETGSAAESAEWAAAESAAAAMACIENRRQTANIVRENLPIEIWNVED